MKPLVLISAFVTLLAFSCSAQKKIAAKDASKYSGQTVMICDKVYSTEPVSGSNLTLLHMGSETNEYLTVLVKGSSNTKIKWHPEIAFKGRDICVTGKVINYKGKPAIMVDTASQLKMNFVDNVAPVSQH